MCVSWLKHSYIKKEKYMTPLEENGQLFNLCTRQIETIPTVPPHFGVNKGNQGKSFRSSVFLGSCLGLLTFLFFCYLSFRSALDIVVNELIAENVTTDMLPHLLLALNFTFTSYCRHWKML